MENTVNERVRKVRNDAGLTQAEFAEKIGKNRISISKIESGESKPRPSTLNVICEEFSIKRHWMNTGDGEIRDIIAISSESDLSTSWSEKAHDALKANNIELKQQVDFLQDMLRKAMSGIGAANFQNDIALAARIVNFDEIGGNIVRVAA